MPAAAVIPAPIVYIRVVAVKKLVVELWAWEEVLRSSWFPGAPTEGHTASPKGKPRRESTLLAERLPRHGQNSTTSFLTATTLIYAIGAGITAAAGTRLALQWLLECSFKSLSLQLPD